MAGGCRYSPPPLREGEAERRDSSLLSLQPVSAGFRFIYPYTVISPLFTVHRQYLLPTPLMYGSCTHELCPWPTGVPGVVGRTRTGAQRSGLHAVVGGERE